jgi:hypothetical protein
MACLYISPDVQALFDLMLARVRRKEAMLTRRVRYGGRKGRRAARRLKEWC